jgi:hypothetical protein
MNTERLWFQRVVGTHGLKATTKRHLEIGDDDRSALDGL